MKTLQVSVCLALCLAKLPAPAQDDDVPSAEFLDFLASWGAEDQEWLDKELENESAEQANTNDEEHSDVD